jgi:putative hydrolase
MDKSLKIFADYHTHTLYSHGRGTIEDNVIEARRKGLKEIAITDHGPGHFMYGVTRKSLARMREEVDRLNEKYPDIRVLLGVEANIVSAEGRLDVDGPVLSVLDILLVGFHFGALPATLKDGYNIHIKNFAGRWTNKMKESIREGNTRALIRAMDMYPVRIITHPGAKADIDTKNLARAAAAKKVALEINSSHGHMTVDYVKIAKGEGAKFVLGSDAHKPGRVGDVKAAVRVARQAGLTASDIINAVKEGGK